MVFKLNISQKGKAWKLELDSETLIGKKLGDIIEGKEISQDLESYELEITGATDFSGFPHKTGIEGSEIKKVLLTKGWGMHYKKQGLRRRKSLRGEQISDKTVQINLNVLKEGSKKLAEIFPDQNATSQKVSEPEKGIEQEHSISEKSEPKIKSETETSVTEISAQEDPKEKVEKEIKEEVKEEIKEDIPTSPETKTEEQKEEAAKKVAEEVVEESKEAIDGATETKK